MKFIEFKIAIMLKRNIVLSEAGYVISQFLSSAMCRDKFLMEKHKGIGFKLFSYDWLYPLAKNGEYESNQIYTFRVRCLDPYLANKLEKVIRGHETRYMRALMVSKNTKTPKRIDKIVTLTPAIVSLAKDASGKVEAGHFEAAKDWMINGLVKKHNCFFEDKLDYQDCLHAFKNFSIISKPIGIKYKGIHLIGIKFEIEMHQDEISQKLAALAECVGLGEKSTAVGAGFVHAVYNR